METQQRKPKMPLALQFIRWAMPKLSALVPFLAKRWAVNLFFTPIKFKTPIKEVEIAKKANLEKITVDGKQIQTYTWGEGDTTILLIHGWAGRGTQFYAFIDSLLEKNCRVIAFDGPSHGLSDGKKTNIIEFDHTLKAILANNPTIDSIISHSFGGAAALYSIAEGLPIKRLALIGTPTIGSEIINEFIKRINGRASIAPYFESYVLQLIGQPFSYYEALNSLKRLQNPLDLLVVHDKNDKEVPFQHAEALVNQYPSTAFFPTEQLGHTRILKNQEVIDRVLKFTLNEKQKLAPVEVY